MSGAEQHSGTPQNVGGKGEGERATIEPNSDFMCVQDISNSFHMSTTTCERGPQISTSPLQSAVAIPSSFWLFQNLQKHLLGFHGCLSFRKACSYDGKISEEKIYATT